MAINNLRCHSSVTRQVSRSKNNLEAATFTTRRCLTCQVLPSNNIHPLRQANSVTSVTYIRNACTLFFWYPLIFHYPRGCPFSFVLWYYKPTSQHFRGVDGSRVSWENFRPTWRNICEGSYNGGNVSMPVIRREYAAPTISPGSSSSWQQDARKGMETAYNSYAIHLPRKERISGLWYRGIKIFRKLEVAEYYRRILKILGQCWCVVKIKRSNFIF